MTCFIHTELYNIERLVIFLTDKSNNKRPKDVSKSWSINKILCLPRRLMESVKHKVPGFTLKLWNKIRKLLQRQYTNQNGEKKSGHVNQHKCTQFAELPMALAKSPITSKSHKLIDGLWKLFWALHGNHHTLNLRPKF